MAELTPAQQVVELQDEFMLESAQYRLDKLPGTLLLINAILDCYLDLSPELLESS